MDLKRENKLLLDCLNKFLRYWIPLIAYCSLIFTLSSFSKPLPVAPPSGVDKLLHIAEYFILGYLAARAAFSLNVRFSHGFLFLMAVVFCVFYGFYDEIHQATVPGRFAGFGDVAADAIGGVFGVTFYWKRVVSKTQITDHDL